MVRIGGQPLGFGKARLSTTEWIVLKQNADFFFPQKFFVCAHSTADVASAGWRSAHFSVFLHR